jgi:cell division transport system permease protein
MLHANVPFVAAAPDRPAPIVPTDSTAAHALVAVIAIMTFLASLSVGAVVLVAIVAGDWQSAIAREVTIQVRPVAGRDLEADVKNATDLARAASGIADVRAYSKAESGQLLEPWLGAGLSLEDLPVPRLIVLKLARDQAPDLDGLRKALSENVPGATLDDHRAWIERMRLVTSTVVACGMAVLGLVVIATVLCVSFATRGAMASNKPVIEVLHLVGARDRFIAGEFQRHFLWLGLQGGGIGAVAAMLVFAIAGWVPDWLARGAGEEQFTALFGRFAIGPAGYGAILALLVLIAIITAATSRFTVYRALGAMESG